VLVNLYVETNVWQTLVWFIITRLNNKQKTAMGDDSSAVYHGGNGPKMGPNSQDVQSECQDQ
jgi:hypothetical protein